LGADAISLIRVISRQKNKNTNDHEWVMNNSINGLFVTIHVKKKEDNKYNKNNFYIPLGINILSL